MERNTSITDAISGMASRINRKVLSSKLNMVDVGSHLGFVWRINRAVADQFVFSRINNEGILMWPTASRELGSFWT